MAVDAEELIIAPFQEVVDRSKEAIENAEKVQGDNSELAVQMMKSAQMVFREGERALKRVQPLWDSQVAKHGDSFKDAVGDNDELAGKRRVLEELLYDFEDFMEADTFDASKYGEIQAATRSFALDVLDFIKRMKIENKTPTTPVHAFPPLPPLPPLPPSIQIPRQLSQPGRQQNMKSQGAHKSGVRTSHGSSDSTTLRRTPSSAKSVASDARSSRHIYEATIAQVVPARREEQRASSPDILGDEDEQLGVASPNDFSQPRTSDWIQEQAPVPKLRHPMRQSIPEHSVATNTTPIDGMVSSVFDPNSPSTTNRTSVYSDSATHSSSNGASPKIPISEMRTSSLAAFQFEPTPPLPPPGQFSDGLMLANEQAVTDSMLSLKRASTLIKEDECLIGPKSSFHQVKGFCDGAQAFRREGYWHGLKQTMAYGEPLPIGRCLNCEYYQVYNELSLDKEGDSRANFLKFGLLYRMRFLIKSHISARTTSEIRYACLFCTHNGHTIHEGDATVFLSADQLLKHLARHPQPLPEVPGVTVLYGKIDGDHPQIEDYDVHFPSPPAPSLFPDMNSLFQLPTATALKNHVQRWGEVLTDPDGNTDVLKFMVGAKIVGIEFPDKWGGKWCTGWHDGTRGPFPAKHVELEGPKQNEISLQSTGVVSLTTRWKWDPPDSARTGWLIFGENETIKNVGWLYQDHWCWSGTNSKGKFGIFPRSHINPHSLKEGVVSPATKRPQASGPMRLFSRRRQSSTASSMSGDT
ncbi:SH3 domain-containing protein [Colletotrichum camelliae]|nr:SH3 domain-containing protein [Colletotrichum camelliae]